MLNRLIALGLFLGLLVGLAAAATGNPFLTSLAQGVAPIGKIFINAIKMVVIPLVVTVIFSSVAGLGDPRKLGRIGGLTLVFYWATLVPAIVIGMLVTMFGLRFAPKMEVPEANALTVPQLQSIADFLVSLVPANPFAAASNGAILPLIVFTVLFAAATGAMDADRRERMITASDDISQTLITLVWWILYTAPVGVFALIAPATSVMGWGLIQSLGIFILCVLAGLIIFTTLIYMPLLHLLGKTSPAKFFKGTMGAASVAFTTTSTAAAIPVSLEESTKNLGTSKTVADLLIPLGASMYRPGSALFQGAAIVFLAHIFGVPLAIGALGAVVLATFLVSLTVAPVPSSSVVTMAPALETIGVPVAGLALILGIDRIPDMMRSTVNVWGQITAAVLIDKR